MLFRGIQFLRPGMLFSHPLPDIDQSRTGGFLDPLLGTFLLTVFGTLLAVPLGVAIAVWLTEYARPFWLARAVESGVEVVAGTPSIVLAIFGLIVFSQGALGFLSFTAEGGAVFGRSFFAAGAMMSLIALPLVVGATREALQAIPRHVREASYALGKTRAATIRRVLLPAARPGIATGTALGMGRIAGDTAIVVILLGASLQLTGARRPRAVRHAAGHRLDAHQLRLRQLARRRGQRAREGVCGRLRAARDRRRAQLHRRPDRSPQERPAWNVMTPPPIRRIVRRREPTVVAPPPPTRAARSRTARRTHRRRSHRRRGPAQRFERRTRPRRSSACACEQLTVAYGGKAAVKSVDLPVRQGEVLALIGPSGCGKTTLLRSLNRLVELTPTATRAGRILLDGEDIDQFEVTSLRRRVSMVFQQPNPFPMSIFDNVAYALREQGSRPAAARAARAGGGRRAGRAGLSMRSTGDLDASGAAAVGRAAAAPLHRALACRRPEVLLLDEPCSALDPRSTATIEELILSLRDEVAVVIVTHNLQQAQRVADHVGFMYLGELVEYGPAERVFGAPREERTREYVSGAFG